MDLGEEDKITVARATYNYHNHSLLLVDFTGMEGKYVRVEGVRFKGFKEILEGK